MPYKRILAVVALLLLLTGTVWAGGNTTELGQAATPTPQAEEEAPEVDAEESEAEPTVYRYILEASATQAAYAAGKANPQDRFPVLVPVFAELGFTLEAYYFAATEVKHYLIFSSTEPMDPLSMEVLLINSIATGGTASFKIVPVITTAEMAEALAGPAAAPTRRRTRSNQERR